jgi:hypothetical protein
VVRHGSIIVSGYVISVSYQDMHVQHWPMLRMEKKDPSVADITFCTALSEYDHVLLKESKAVRYMYDSGVSIFRVFVIFFLSVKSNGGVSFCSRVLSTRGGSFELDHALPQQNRCVYK